MEVFCMGEMNEQVHRLELEKGEADIEGSIDSLVYTEHGPLQKKGSALARLFR